MNKINWNDQFKIRPHQNASRKHEIIKTLLVLNIKEKYSRQLNNIICYTEHKVNNKICDVYFENLLTGDKIYYEIQKVLQKRWKRATQHSYNGIEGDWFLIEEERQSDNLIELDNQIKGLVV